MFIKYYGSTWCTIWFIDFAVVTIERRGNWIKPNQLLVTITLSTAEYSLGSVALLCHFLFNLYLQNMTAVKIIDAFTMWSNYVMHRSVGCNSVVPKSMWSCSVVLSSMGCNSVMPKSMGSCSAVLWSLTVATKASSVVSPGEWRWGLRWRPRLAQWHVHWR